jgi:curved DNA-binding protein CbpA
MTQEHAAKQIHTCKITKEFEAVNGINEAKIVFKKLAKILHPDVGGTNQEFKLLNKIYNDILENKIYFSNEAKFDIELEKIISQILHYEDITIEVVGSWIWLSGNTKAIKETLKELNFKWASKKKMWYYGEMKGKNIKPKSMDEIKSKYGCETLKSKGKYKIAS